MLSLTNITLCLSSASNTSALSYSSNVNIGFTFNPTLSVNISPSDLIISNLVPGSTADSNSINISVATNAAWGYTLSAIASDNSLNHIGSNDKFDSIATDASLTNLTTDNTWGYSYKDNTVQTPAWSNYSGLSSSISKTLLDTNTNNTETGIDNIDFKIAAKASNTQASGTYTNTITFTAVTKPTPPTLYETVQSLAKKDTEGNERTQTPAELQAAITYPTSTNHTEDTSNSGVYKYDAETFGNASDAAIGYNIYYYRGILEPGNETHGSSGTATTYPNYVRLANNTCWRIVRTTGSGGVKMIYNGVWDTTNATCANSGEATIVGKSAFNTGFRQAVAVGYTYNNAYAKNIETDRTIAELYGTNTNYLGNSTNSTIKTYVENWFTNSMGNNYDKLLESSAGYCNDRTVYNENYELQNENTVSMAQYSTDTAQYYYGAYVRNATNAQNPSLHCPRDTVDLYTTSGSANGNKQLSRPAALLTADEASFAGAGQCYNPSGGSNTHAHSYLRNSVDIHLISGFARRSSGGVANYNMTGIACIRNNNDSVFSGWGVRPVVSLKSNTLVLDGTGTATSPWTIE